MSRSYKKTWKLDGEYLHLVRVHDKDTCGIPKCIICGYLWKRESVKKERYNKRKDIDNNLKENGN